MASELQAVHTTGRTLYALLRNAVGQVYSTVTGLFGAYATASLADYDVALTEQGTASGFYAGTMPAVAAGVYAVVVYDRAGGSPAEGDAVVAAGTVYWDGTIVIPLPSKEQNADALIGRNIAGGSNGGRTVKEALAASRNKVVRSGSTLTVYDTDDATVLWSATITSDPSAATLTGVDPT